MSETCETIKVVSENSPDGFVVINKSDYDAETQKLYGAEQEDDMEAVKPVNKPKRR